MKPRARPPAERIEDMLLGPARLQAVYVAVRLGIPDMVRDGARSSTLLASSAGVHPEALHRLMRFLVADGVFKLGEGGRFASTPVSDSLTMDAPGGHRQQVLNTAMRTWDAWRDVLYSVETGQPAFERVNGVAFAEDQARNGGWLARENGPRLRNAAGALKAMVLGEGTVVVAGSGSAELLAGLLGKSGKQRGIACDAPAAAEWSREVLAPLGERACLHAPTPGGRIPRGGDLYVLAGLLRESGDAGALSLLQECHGVMPPGRRLVLLETALADDAVLSRADALADLELLLTCGGRERTLREFVELLPRAGFRFEGCEVTRAGLSAISASKGLL